MFNNSTLKLRAVKVYFVIFERIMTSRKSHSFWEINSAYALVSARNFRVMDVKLHHIKIPKNEKFCTDFGAEEFQRIPMTFECEWLYKTCIQYVSHSERKNVNQVNYNY